MGKYTFQWEHPADEVYVTGTFDDWGKTVKLDKGADGVFSKTVDLPDSDKDIKYKFVKDGNWVTSHTAPTDTDESGNTNNVLKPSDFVSSAAPAATTTAMAGAVPKETPGAFPATPGAGAAAEEPKDFSVNPIPASEGAGNPVDLKPGEKVPDPSTINSNTIASGVHDDPELKAQDEAKQKAAGEQPVSVNPIPATAGLGNPIDLKPGEKVPDSSTVTANTVNSTVKTDKESYEKSDAYPGADSNKPLDTAGGAFGVAPVSNNIIPESGIPSGQGISAKEADPGVTIQSAAPESSTAALAGQVPKEPRRNLDENTSTAAISSAAPAATTAALAGQVPKEGAASGVPEEVKESQKEAGVGPEASANPEAVQEKAAVEKELLKEVKPEESAGEPAPTEAAATSATAPTATEGAANNDTLKAPVESEPVRSRDVSPMTKAPTTDTAATGGVAASETSGATPSKKENLGRRMSASFKKWAGEGGPAGTKDGTADTSGTTAAASSSSAAPAASSSPAGKEAKGHKKKQSIFKKIKEAFK